METRTGLLVEKLDRPEVEELVLQGGARRHLRRVGGLDDQIEAITDAVELPYLYRGFYTEHKIPRPKGILRVRPARLREDPDRQGRGQLAGQEGGRSHRQYQRAELLPQYQGT